MLGQFSGIFRMLCMFLQLYAHVSTFPIVLYIGQLAKGTQIILLQIKLL